MSYAGFDYPCLVTPSDRLKVYETIDGHMHNQQECLAFVTYNDTAKISVLITKDNARMLRAQLDEFLK